MKLKGLMMAVVTVAFAYSASAADVLTYWLCYKVSQKGYTYSYSPTSEKPTKLPPAGYLIVPVLGAGSLGAANGKVAGGISFVEKTSNTSADQYDIPGFAIYSAAVGKKASTFGQGYTETALTQDMYAVYGVGAGIKGKYKDKATKKTTAIAVPNWSSKMAGSFSLLTASLASTQDSGTWALTLDGTSSASMTATIDPTKTVAENYTAAMVAFSATAAKDKYSPVSK